MTALRQIPYCDVVIIGGGICGLSASVGAASEGLCTILVDSSFTGFGGQAATSSLIENLIGFSGGITGKRLIDNAILQAEGFHVYFFNPFNVIAIRKAEDGYWEACNDDGDCIRGKAILLCMGVSYKLLEAQNAARFTGSGISYGSPSLSDRFENSSIAIVGGANSAGQAAIHLSECPTCHVYLLIRGESIEDKMSTYLIQKLRNRTNVEILTNTIVTSAIGGFNIEQIIIKTGEITNTLSISRLFVLIGAKPKTYWLKGVVPLDEFGFIRTGGDDLHSMEAIDGVFAAGDVRSGSVKRVVSAAAEGSNAVSEIHNYIASFNSRKLVVE